MLEFWQLILGFIGGGGLSYVFTLRANKRLKTAEATAKEVEVLRDLVSTLREEITRLTQKQDTLELRLRDKDELATYLYRQIDEKDKKYHIKKQAINCAISCKTPNSECPVLTKLAELEK